MRRLVLIGLVMVLSGCGGEGGDDGTAKPAACHGNNSACKAATVAWDASLTATGYRVYYGFNTPGVYPTSVDVGSALKAVLGPFTVGQVIYVVVKAYNSGGESGPSEEVSKAL